MKKTADTGDKTGSSAVYSRCTTTSGWRRASSLHFFFFKAPHAGDWLLTSVGPHRLSCLHMTRFPHLLKRQQDDPGTSCFSARHPVGEQDDANSSPSYSSSSCAVSFCKIECHHRLSSPDKSKTARTRPSANEGVAVSYVDPIRTGLLDRCGKEASVWQPRLASDSIQTLHYGIPYLQLQLWRWRSAVGVGGESKDTREPGRNRPGAFGAPIF